MTTRPTSILDVLEVPEILAHLCCDYLGPKDILSLEAVSKRTKELIDKNACIWNAFALKHAGREIPDALPPGLSPKDIFLRMYEPAK